MSLMFCDECGGRLIFDECNHEYYCCKCGLVVGDEPLTVSNMGDFHPLRSRYDYWNWSDTPFLAKRGCKSWMDTRTWRQQRQNLELRFVINQLGLTCAERGDVYYILDHMRLKEIHGNVGYSIIFVGVCRYVLMYSRPQLVDSVCFNDLGLSDRVFSVIERNINCKLHPNHIRK